MWKHAVPAVCAALVAAAGAFADVVAVKAAVLHIGDGTRVEGAVVVIEDGVVSAVGPGVAIPSGASIIDVPECHVTPGLIDANAIIEADDMREAPRPRVAGGELAPLLSTFRPWMDRDRSEEESRRGLERFGTTQACACATCSGFAMCPLAEQHAQFAVEGEDALGCPCCGFPSKGPLHTFVSGVRPSAMRVEASSEVVAHTRMLDGVSLRSRDFERLVDGGVTTVFIAPDSSAVIGPMGAVVHTGGPMGSRVVDSTAAVQANLGSDPYALGLPNEMPFGGMVSTRTRRPTTRMGVVWVFRKAFYDAARLEEGVALDGADISPEPALEVLAKVRSGEVPLRIHARDANDIEQALALSEEFGLDPTIVEAAEAHLMVEELAARRARVVLGPLSDARIGLRAYSADKIRMKSVTARALFDAGLEPALSAADLRDEDGLARQAMTAVRQGLTVDEAVRAVTLNPARILGIEDRVGTIAAGKRADLVVWSGEPFAATSSPAAVIVGGVVVRGETTERK